MATHEYRARYVDGLLDSFLAELPAVLITGPRGCGKSTTALRRAASAVSLDVEATASAVRIDPDAFLASQQRPLVIDEWQEVPEVLGALKRAVDKDSAPGQFILTGSVRAQMSPGLWPGTGRVVRVRMGPLSQREIHGFHGDIDELFLHRLFTGNVPAERSDRLTIDQYIAQAARGGFPEALRLDRTRRAWFDSYLDQLTVHDMSAIGESVDSDRLRAYVEANALNTAGVLAQSSLAQMAGINVHTADRYDSLLTDIGIVDNIPAWSANRVSRMEKRPKRFMADMGLAIAASRVTEEQLRLDGPALGRFIEGYVHAQLQAEARSTLTPMRVHHLRTVNGRQEVDFVVEGDGGRLIAVEVKAGAAVSTRDARHLAWLRDTIGESFVAGVVLHTGEHAFELGDRLWAAPIASLWAA